MDNMNLIPVEGHKNLYRDGKTGAIVNDDSSGYSQYMRLKNQKLGDICITQITCDGILKISPCIVHM